MTNQEIQDFLSDIEDKIFKYAIVIDEEIKPKYDIQYNLNIINKYIEDKIPKDLSNFLKELVKNKIIIIITRKITRDIDPDTKKPITGNIIKIVIWKKANGGNGDDIKKIEKIIKNSNQKNIKNIKNDISATYQALEIEKRGNNVRNISKIGTGIVGAGVLYYLYKKWKDKQEDKNSNIIIKDL